VLDRLTEVGLVDDAAYAQAWVRSRSVGRGLAGPALARELRTRGVDPAVVSAAVGRLDPDEEAATALALVQRRLAGTRRLPHPVRVRRMVAMLARRGYAEGLAQRVVRDALRSEALSAGLARPSGAGGDGSVNGA
jgi:regulatory protein